MHRSCPLPTAHPELTVHQCPGYYEFRVENWHLARDGSGKIIRGAKELGKADVILVLLLSVIWPKVSSSSSLLLVTISIAFIYAWAQCTQVLSESLIVISPHGIQLETKRGLPPFHWFSSRRFIPFTTLHDVLLNEGLSGWNVRYYLAVLRKDTMHPPVASMPEQSQTQGEYKLEVAFENILPHFPVLSRIFNDVQDVLWGSIGTQLQCNGNVSRDQP